MKCPLCHQSPTAPWRCQQGTPIFDCQRCGHRFANVVWDRDFIARTYSDDYFFAGGAGYSDYLAERYILSAHGARYADLISRYIEPGSVLDIGAAAGFILHAFIKRGWTGRGVEPNQSMALHGRNKLGLDIVCEPFEKFNTDQSFDVVLMIQVIAHFADPLGALRRAYELLRPGGLLLIEGWDRQSKTARLFGRYWHEYSPPSVLHWFSQYSLCRLLEENCFSFVARGRPVKRLQSEHAKSLVRYKMGSGILGRMGDGLLRIVPDHLSISYPLDDLFWILTVRS